VILDPTVPKVRRAQPEGDSMSTAGYAVKGGGLTAAFSSTLELWIG